MVQESSADVPEWQKKVLAKQAAVKAKFPKEWLLPADLLDSLPSPLVSSKVNLNSLDIPRRSGLLSEREIEITEAYYVPALLAKLASGDLTSLEVTLAFSKRAAIAQQLTNCLTETLFDEAQARAQQLDDLRAKGQLAGPLHGLPVSLKDCFQVVGTQATVGVVAYLDQTSTTDSALVEMLRVLGAVVYVKTNIPQTMMTADSDNNIFGRTLNPWNTALTAGGSSGGEGALLAFRGSPLGIGTDVAGSIRIPASCCGTYGFKPTANRIPYGGQVAMSSLGLRAILPSAGPLANDIEALEVLAKAVIDLGPAKYDAKALDVPWRAVRDDDDDDDVAGGQKKEKLRFGLLAADAGLPLHPPVARALAEAVRRLEAQGHAVVRLAPEEGQVTLAQEVAGGLFSLDTSGAELVSSSGEPAIPSRLVNGERALRWKAELPDLGELDRLGKYGFLEKRRAEIEDGWRAVWARHRLDAVLAPSAQNTAVEHDAYGLAPYTSFLNLLNYPSCAIPFGRVTIDSDKPIPYTKMDGVIAPDYNPELLEGAPCSLQVFTRGMRDEECLAISKIVDACLKKEA